MGLTTRSLFIAAGWLSLGLGFVGAFVPVLPTTPLVLLAAYFFSKGSPRLHAWLLRQPRLGKLIFDWQRHGVIRLRAKILSTALIVPLFAYTLGFVPVPLALKGLLAAIGLGVLAFIWSRPSKPRTDSDPQNAAAPAAENRAAPAENSAHG